MDSEYCLQAAVCNLSLYRLFRPLKRRSLFIILRSALGSLETQRVLGDFVLVSTQGEKVNVSGELILMYLSGWIYRAVHKHGYTESPELVALFARCSRLFQLPFIPIFVFDGPGRPNIKRGRRIRGNDHWLTGHFQQML